MNNITEKYNGKNGNEGDILYFIITDYHINLKAKNILVKYEMVSNNLLDNFEKGRVKKSYIVADVKGVYNTNTVTTKPEVLDEEGNILEEAIIEEVQVAEVEEDLRFTKWQKYPLAYALEQGIESLEDLFFLTTREYILEINGYTSDDLYIKEENIIEDNAEEVE